MPSLRQLYFSTIKELKNPNDEIDIRVLLSHINNINSLSDLYLKFDEEIRDLELFENLKQSYLSGVPMAYLIKNASFCGLDLYVDNRVLIPRPETEEVVEYAAKKIKEIFGEIPVSIIDVCTGSGCLGIALSKRVNVNQITMSDISESVLEVCKINAQNFLGNITYSILQSDGLKSINNINKFDVLVANPPYILKGDKVDDSVLKNEPNLALFVDDKLSIYKSILKTISSTDNKIKLVVFEIGESIKTKLVTLITTLFPKATCEVIKDINGKDRIVGLIL